VQQLGDWQVWVNDNGYDWFVIDNLESYRSGLAGKVSAPHTIRFISNLAIDNPVFGWVRVKVQAEGAIVEAVPTSGGGGDPTIAFRSLTSTSYANRTNTVLAAPAGLANGDILIAMIVTGQSGSVPPLPAPPAGFAPFGTDTNVNDGSFYGRLGIFWKRAAGESGSYTFSHATCSSQGLLKAYSGCLGSGTPLGATANRTGFFTGSIGDSITTTAANSYLLYEAHDWTGSGALAPPTGMTERFDGLIYSADEPIVAAGATGTRAQTNANAAGGEPWAVRMVELLAA
jgi:hypothetical protein